MLDAPLISAIPSAGMALCQEALRLAEQLPKMFREGNAGKEILDRLAFLLQQLSGDARPQIDASTRATLVKVQEHIHEAERTAAQWMNAATPRLEQLARSRTMRKAYGKGRLGR